jgi:pimeloyl-ACP methyl ester carboxylesterase
MFLIYSRAGTYCYADRYAAISAAQAAAATLYVGGTNDAVVDFARPYVDNLEKSAPNLWDKVLLPGVEHWTEQEAPPEVNRLMVAFLRGVDGKSPAK